MTKPLYPVLNWTVLEMDTSFTFGNETVRGFITRAAYPPGLFFWNIGRHAHGEAVSFEMAKYAVDHAVKALFDKGLSQS